MAQTKTSLDLPTSWSMASSGTDEFTARMQEAINGMMLDMIAAIARKDYDDRRRRQAQGIQKAKQEGRYRGRPEDQERNAAIVKMLKAGQSWNNIVAATGASRSTLARLAKRSHLALPSPRHKQVVRAVCPTTVLEQVTGLRWLARFSAAFWRPRPTSRTAARLLSRLSISR
ncbi:hypothetical protein MES5069_800002 [Mesorhizobium escarrei]|uniref:Resolvase/invertase-type recombinase catalytic domain-containing protein n=1 Tax=Mesorhizobium escarrei TaxID=666018 RepID=A0ABM9EK59_9HYPH|nr:hypothetical protein MES5069_800002 [Mesorhizobium escarrei]